MDPDLRTCIFAYDLAQSVAVPLVSPPVDEAPTCLASELADASLAPGSVRLFWGTALGAVCVGTLVPRAPRHSRRGGGSPLDDADTPPTLALRISQKRIDGHSASISALCHCAPRNVLCTGAADGTVCVWALAPRELKAGSTQLLGRLNGPRPMGAIVSLTAVLPPGGGSGAPRVVGGGSDGHVFEWDLRGGRVCRSIQQVHATTSSSNERGGPPPGPAWLAPWPRVPPVPDLALPHRAPCPAVDRFPPG